MIFQKSRLKLINNLFENRLINQTQILLYLYFLLNRNILIRQKKKKQGKFLKNGNLEIEKMSLNFFKEIAHALR